MNDIVEQLRDWHKWRFDLDTAIGGETPHEKTLLVEAAADEITALRARIAEQEAEIARVRKLYQQACDMYQRKNRSGCCCKFSEDEETVISVCAAHEAWRDAEIARLRVLLAHAVKEADGWHDESRGGPIEDDAMIDAARKEQP